MSESTNAHDLLEKHFGFREFLEGQEPVVDAILGGEDVLVIMPTGGGKSLCYQLPAMALEGITVVVSPLIALMKDQVDGLVEKGIPATYINSSLAQGEMDERIANMAQGKYRLLYIAPERFKSARFVETLAPLSIALFAIDEAHCISQWGHDFRPDYLRLKWVLKDLGNPQIAALTATATPEVRDDIIEQLSLGKFGRQPPRTFVSGFARHNLTLGVVRVKGKVAKLDRITSLIKQHKTGIVYCATRKNVELVAEHLRFARIKSIYYHGGMGDEDRSDAQNKFMDGTSDVAVATNAFGMGIDRPDLRFVIHYDIPGSIEAYYQEAGRAGRDGEPSRCEVLFNYADIRTQEFFIEGANPTREIVAGLHSALKRVCGRGPIEMPISDIADLVPFAKNGMAVGSALYLLERAEFITREYRQGSRTYTTRLVEPVKELDQLDVDFQRLDKKRERDQAKLQRMIAYADHQTCRHHFILQYFGDVETGEGCTVCDNCLAKSTAAARFPTDEETVVIQKALSCVARVDGRFGRGRIVQTLVGSRSKEVIDAGLDRLSTYGLLRELDTDYVWALLNTLVRVGCVTVGTGQYPTIALTPMGWEVMQKKQRIPMVLPEKTSLPAAPARSRERKPRSSPLARGAVEGADIAAPSGDYDVTLYEALREWRKKTASKMGGVPAYLVYPDRTLEELARLKPTTEEQLLEVKGIGAAKARRFGEETLAIIAQHKESHVPQK